MKTRQCSISARISTRIIREPAEDERGREPVKVLRSTVLYRPVPETGPILGFSRRSPRWTIRPDLVLISSGFDAHRDDPLASMCLIEHGYAK